jgi:hypothetical protein
LPGKQAKRYLVRHHMSVRSSTSLAERFSGFGGHHSAGCGRQFSENRIKM